MGAPSRASMGSPRGKRHGRRVGVAHGERRAGPAARRQPRRLSARSYLRPSADGTVELHLDAALDPRRSTGRHLHPHRRRGPADRHRAWTPAGGHAHTFPASPRAATPRSSRWSARTTDSTSTWTLTGDGDEGSDYAVHGFDVDELGFEVVLTPASFAGSASFALHVDLGAGDAAHARLLTRASTTRRCTPRATSR